MRRAVRLIILALILSCVVAHASRAGEGELSVRLASGREFRGAIDPASTADTLVLRSDWNGTVLQRPIQWSRVVKISAAGQPLDISALRAQAAENQAAPPGNGAGAKPTIDKKKFIRRLELHGDLAPVEQQSSVMSEANQRVAMVVFDAAIVNWDADVETDGVALQLVPLSDERQLLPVQGTLEIELFARHRQTPDLAPQSGGDTLDLVERWTRAVQPEDFGSSGALYRLPFGAITPELQPKWTAWHYGLVHVRFSVPGHGVFDDSRDGLRIRPWAPNRDRLEMTTGQRFLSTENLGRRD